MSGPCTDCGGPDYQTLMSRNAELESGGTAYDAGYQAAKADMEERVYRAEAALAQREQDKMQYIGAIAQWVESLPTLLSNVIDEVTIDLLVEEGSE